MPLFLALSEAEVITFRFQVTHIWSVLSSEKQRCVGFRNLPTHWRNLLPPDSR